MPQLIAILPGDGIGPEVTEVASSALEALSHRFDLDLELRHGEVGGAAIDATGDPLPDETLKLCQAARAVLLGAVGGPKWADAQRRPEQGLLDLRKALGLFSNLRPVKTHPALVGASPLKPERLKDVDIMVVRELTGGIYFGKKEEGGSVASDECRYSENEIARVVRFAAELARTRQKRLTSIDKANVLATSRLWRRTTDRIVTKEYPDVELEHLLVDAAAMHLLSRPADFDVLVTENMFGDILTDEASMLAGSLGVLPSASLNETGHGLYEPIHGSAPDIAGRGIANPCGTLLSAAMLLRHSLGADKAAAALEEAVYGALSAGAKTKDLDPNGIDTAAMAVAVIERI